MPQVPHYAIPFTIPDAQTDHIQRKMFDLPYADTSQAQKLDIYWPDDGNGPFPVIISIHGGAFMGGDKRDIQLMPMLEATKRGYALVSINYRLSGEAKFPALVQDVKAAIRWVRAQATLYLFDPERIATWGGSAGGYLSLMAGVSAGLPELEDLTLGNASQPCHVQAVVDWFGPTDFLLMDEQLAASGMAPAPDQAHSGADSPESLLLGQKITEIPALVRAANPETYIHPGLPPFLIQHGDHDDTVPHQQSVNMAAKLTAVLGPEKVKLELLAGARHGGPAFETPENIQKVLAFLDKALRV
ncbi:MAG: alpha/beta hydrolase [Anaerolineales bacterium]|jgi:acetyl esterase/lipase|nr:alpha/beta hydrolase [Anaerolineales bacterium]